MTRSPRIGIGGPVGSGKTMLCLKLCQRLRERYSMAVVTNDIYCSEDAQFLIKHSALPADRIAGVETGGCPHTAIREDASINLEAVDRMLAKYPNADIVFIESGGDNLAATFTAELVDYWTYVIDTAAGDDAQAIYGFRAASADNMAALEYTNRGVPCSRARSDRRTPSSMSWSPA